MGNKIIAAAREAVELARNPVFYFVEESNRIEGIYSVKATEVSATERFLALETLTLENICDLQSCYAPGKPIRDRVGMNVRVGNYVAPSGGRYILVELMSLVGKLNKAKPGIYDDPWTM